MARGGSSMIPGVGYHVISRFVAKEWFVESVDQRRGYLSAVGDNGSCGRIGVASRMR